MNPTPHHNAHHPSELGPVPDGPVRVAVEFGRRRTGETSFTAGPFPVGLVWRAQLVSLHLAR